MIEKRRTIVTLAAFSLGAALLGANMLSVKSADAETVNDVFTATGLTVTENVARSSLVNGDGTALFTNATEVGLHLQTENGGTGTFALKNQVSGNFEMEFQPYADVNGTANFSEFSLNFSDGTNEFSVLLSYGGNWDAKIGGYCVKVGDDTYFRHINIKDGTLNSYRANRSDLATCMYGSTFDNQRTAFLNYWGTNGSTIMQSPVIGYDPIENQVYTYGWGLKTQKQEISDLYKQKIVIWDLDQGDDTNFTWAGGDPKAKTAVPSLEKYSVTLSMTAKDGLAAKTLVSKINGVSLETTDGAVSSELTKALSAFEDTATYDVAISDYITADENVSLTQNFKQGSITIENNRNLYAWSATGVKAEVVGEGKITFNKAFNESFEMDFQGWGDKQIGQGGSLSSNESSYGLRDMEISFDDGSNAFTILISAGAAEAGSAQTPAAYLRYDKVNGVATVADKYSYFYAVDTATFNNYRVNKYPTNIMGTSFANLAKVGGSYNDANIVSNKIGFDKDTMEVYAWGVDASNNPYKFVIWDLDEKRTSFAGYEGTFNDQPIISSMGAYKVSVTMKSGNDGANKAYVLLKSVNGIALNTENGKLNAELKKDYTSKVTFKNADGSEITTVEQENGTTIADLAYSPAAKNVWVGWSDENGKLYKPEGFIVNGNATLTAVEVGFEMTKGASIRLSDSEADSGIRFENKIAKADADKLGDALKAYGTIIAPTANIGVKDFEIGVDGLTVLKHDNQTSFLRTDDGTEYLVYRLAMHVSEGHYDWKYSARGYLEIEYANGTTGYVYTDYSEDDNARSIAGIAALVLENDKDSLSSEQLAIVECYIQNND